MKDQRDTTLAVQGMTCPACVRHVTEALQDLAGVGRIDVELRAASCASSTTRPPPPSTA
jgi:Cu+-exporting ATPase